jgi:hypothetical protein
MTKILSIGDLHGRAVWEKFADIHILANTPNLETDYDYYVFTGDYTDSFTISNPVILSNLRRLIQFKENYPDKVILLLGNHDLQYLLGELHRCSGYRPEAYFDLHELFRDKRSLFQAAFQHGKTIWSHAGIHRGWYNIEFPFSSPNVADDLNGAFLQNVKSMFDVGHRRGGFKNQGGPFWADKHETFTKPLNGYNQVIGHTPVQHVKRYALTSGECLYYIDSTDGKEADALQLEFDENGNETYWGTTTYTHPYNLFYDTYE